MAQTPSTKEVTREVIAYSLLTDKSGMLQLLERNGVQMPNNPSDKEVTIAVLMAAEKSPVYKQDLAKFLTGKVKDAHNKIGSGYKSFAADDRDFSFTGLGDFQNFTAKTNKDKIFNAGSIAGSSIVNTSGAKPIIAASTKGKTKVGSALQSIGDFLKNNILTKDNIQAGINLGLSSIANKTAAGANQTQAEALAIQQRQIEIDANMVKPQNSSGLTSTTKYILIGIGVLLVIGTAVIVIKKYKK
jgi:hypothetical protein